MRPALCAGRCRNMIDPQTTLSANESAPGPRPGSQAGPPSSRGLWSVLRPNLGAMLPAAAVTLAVELGAYALAAWSGASARGALLASLAVATMWVALASAPLAAGGRDVFSAALRGAVPADASLLTLLVLWPLARGPASGPYLSLAGVAEAYCVLAAMAVFSIAAVACARSRPGRQTAALAAAIVLAAAIATPFWTSGLLHALPDAPAKSADAWALRANPFTCVTVAVTERVGFFWHEWGLMYEAFGTFRPYPPPPALWYSAPIFWTALAGALGLAAVVRCRLAKKPRWTL